MNRIDDVRKLSQYGSQVMEMIETAKYILTNEHEKEDVLYYECMNTLGKILPEMNRIVTNQVENMKKDLT